MHTQGYVYISIAIEGRSPFLMQGQIRRGDIELCSIQLFYHHQSNFDPGLSP